MLAGEVSKKLPENPWKNTVMEVSWLKFKKDPVFQSTILRKKDTVYRPQLS